MADNPNKRVTHTSGLLVGSFDLSEAAFTLDKDRHAGRAIVTSIAATQTVTLPAATGSGAVFTFIIGVTATGDKIIQVANATDEFAGIVYQVDSDTSDALVAYPAIAADNFDTVTLNGTTTGGLAGDKITLVDVASGLYHIEGHTVGNGIVATPLSAAV